MTFRKDSSNPQNNYHAPGLLYIYRWSFICAPFYSRQHPCGINQRRSQFFKPANIHKNNSLLVSWVFLLWEGWYQLQLRYLYLAMYENTVAFFLANAQEFYCVRIILILRFCNFVWYLFVGRKKTRSPPSLVPFRSTRSSMGKAEGQKKWGIGIKADTKLDHTGGGGGGGADSAGGVGDDAGGDVWSVFLH